MKYLQSQKPDGFQEPLNLEPKELFKEAFQEASEAPEPLQEAPKNESLEDVQEAQEALKSSERLLEMFFERFPNTFFREPEKIKPLQVRIHKPLRKIFPEYSWIEIKKALVLYSQTIDYCKVLALGGQRIDLDGNPCGEIKKQHINDAKKRIESGKMRSAYKRERFKLSPPKPPPTNADELVSGKMEISVKIKELPTNSKTLKENGWEQFIIDTDGLDDKFVRVTVRPKAWKKLQKAANEYPQWVANIRGKIGKRITIPIEKRKESGFVLDSPSIQIFEIKPKEAKEPIQNEEKT